MFFRNGSWDSDNEFLYTGRRLDPETGLYQYRERYYHSQLGRFINRDPIFYGGSQWNLYEYVSGSPVNWLDPFGQSKGGKKCVRPSEIPADWTAEQIKQYMEELLEQGVKKGSKRFRAIAGWLKVVKRGGCMLGPVAAWWSLTEEAGAGSEIPYIPPPIDPNYDEWVDDHYHSMPEGIELKCDCKCRSYRRYTSGSELESEEYGEWHNASLVPISPADCKALETEHHERQDEDHWYNFFGNAQWMESGVECKVENCSECEKD